MRFIVIVSLLLVSSISSGVCRSWPTYRYDANRSAVVPGDGLADTLHLIWTRSYPPPQPAWDRQKEVYCYGGPAKRTEQRCSFDIVYEPVVAESTVVFASPNNDRVTALRLSDGSERWRFYAAGPIRLAPALAMGNVYVGSDDGFLYCLRLQDGALVWKRRLAFTPRKVLGNDRMISVWPVRGAPVLDESGGQPTVFCAAGLYSFEGAGVYALDARTGATIWLNDGSGMFFTGNPHRGSEGIAGIAPQGYLALAGTGGVLVPNGRALPALFDRATGELQYWRHGGMPKGLGGYHIAVHGDTFSCRDHAFLLEDGSKVGPAPRQFNEWDLQITVGERVFRVDSIREADFAGERARQFTVTDGSWTATVDGLPKSLIAAHGRLLVSTVTGNLYCFGNEPAAAPPVLRDQAKDSRVGFLVRRRARRILQRAGYLPGQRGVALVIGLEDGRLIEALTQQADDLTVIGFEPDSTVVVRARGYLDNRGIYGRRAHVLAERFSQAMVPSYCARVITTGRNEAALDKQALEEVFRALRPYGGAAILAGTASETAAAHLSDKPGVEVSGNRRRTHVRRRGPLAGADSWTHEHHDASQSNFSHDQLVRPPLGLLWFGGSADNTNGPMLPRHGHGQSPQIAGGHLYQMGRDLLRCVDQYTGRVLWEKPLPYLGQFSNYSEHEAGNIGLGDYFTAQHDRVYVLCGRDSCELSRSCLVLDPATGVTLDEFTLPDGGAWGMVAVSDSLLIAASRPIAFDSAAEGGCWVYQYEDISLVGPGGLKTLNFAASRTLFVLDRYSGEVLWETKAQTSFFHRAVVAGDGRLFAIDKFPVANADAAVPSTLKAWDLHDGTLLWADSSERVFARYLAYSEEHDLLLQASRASRDYYKGEPRPNRMVAYHAADGRVAWEIAPELDPDSGSILAELYYYGGPVMLNDRTIITQSGNDFGAIDLLTGRWHRVTHPLTHDSIDFSFRRHYGCTYAKGCPSLIAFRSGSAGMFDLERMSGVHTFGGFKSGCTPSLIPAGGLLNAPEYTRTCACSYPLQTSCALAHNPSTEIWTTNEGLATRFNGGVLRRLGVNFGAPGDRAADDGTLWLEYPPGAAKSAFSAQEHPVSVRITGEQAPRFYRHHSARYAGEAPWIGCSGVEGATRIDIDLTLDSLTPDSVPAHITAPRRTVDVVLYFAEPHDSSAEARVFDITINGETVSSSFDPYLQAGAVRTTVAHRFGPIAVGDSLTVSLTPRSGKTVLSGIGVLPRSQRKSAPQAAEEP